MKGRLVLLLFALSSLAVSARAVNIGKASDLARLLFEQKGVGQTFELDVRVIAPTTPDNTNLAVADDSGAVILNLGPKPPSRKLAAGDRIRIAGSIAPRENGQIIADCRPPQFIASGMPDTINAVSPESFLSGKHYGRRVKISGLVSDAFHDEIDPDFLFLILNCNGLKIHAAVKRTLPGLPDTVGAIIGQKISIKGVCDVLRRGGRQFIGYYLRPYVKSDVQILSPQPDPFNVPDLGNLFMKTPSEISELGRRQITGRVIAVYERHIVMVKTQDGQTILADLTDKNLPAFGETIQIVGFPESNLFRVNLVRAIWRKAPPCKINEDAPTPVTARSLMKDLHNQPKFNHLMHGRTIRLTGRILSLQGPGNDDGKLYLKDGEVIIPVDASATPDIIRNLSIGCKIETTGVCIMESDNWRPNSVFPHIKGVMVVVRTPDDIRILARPPWWTPGRLLAVIGTLLAALFGIFVWNRLLNRRAEQRGKELAAEQVAHVTSDLKVYERTRLAVELHDSLSQNLTGVSLAIRAANRLADSDPDGMRRSLGLASKTLDSCRDELRNCLWDLRNQTLEESDMNEAIQQTLAPHVGDAKLTIRFNVPRERLSDNTAHSILHIIRELASNAVRHGNATEIKVAGTIENDRLLFSVSDNGCGFDPENHPTIADGHFGLQGIQDRVDGLEGDMTIQSAPGKGTKVTISIKTTSHQPLATNH